MQNYDRFEHEHKLMQCWAVTDDLRVLAEGILEGNMTTDDAANVLLGLQTLYSLKFNALWDSFESSIHSGMGK